MSLPVSLCADWICMSVCRFYNRGKCNWGSNCRYLHVESKSIKVCRFFNKGKCKLGQACHYLHVIRTASNMPLKITLNAKAPMKTVDKYPYQCSCCNGTGKCPSDDPKYQDEDCGWCDGRGSSDKPQPNAPPSKVVDCPYCKGKGNDYENVFDPFQKCYYCNGSGTII